MTRPRPGLSRNDPFVIRTRIRGVTLVTLFSVAATSLLVYTCTPNSWGGTLQALGLSHPTGVETVAAVLLTGVLFAGPLVERAVEWEVEGLVDGRLTMVGWRNYVVVGFSAWGRYGREGADMVGGIGAAYGGDCVPRVYGAADAFGGGFGREDGNSYAAGVWDRCV